MNEAGERCHQLQTVLVEQRHSAERSRRNSGVYAPSGFSFWYCSRVESVASG
jgi:hypothetical protein